MFAGIFQRLTIVEQRPSRLVLRELPLFDWLIAFSMLLVAIILSLAGVTFTSVLAVIFALFFVSQGRVRLITFDVPADAMEVSLQTPLTRNVPLALELHTVSRAYLYKGEDGGTQIILVKVNGEELGLSAYSRDTTAWKEDVVIAINTILHHAQHADGDPAE